MKARNLTVVFLAVALMAAGFVGVLFVGQIINPPATEVVVAKVEIPVGTVLTEDMLAADTAQLSNKVLGSLVSAAELKQYVGGVMVEPVHQYQPLPKAAISREGNPASGHRLALVLDDPALVAMVVPVNEMTAPDAIVEGDFVNLNFGATDTRFGEKLSTRPTEAADAGAANTGWGETPTGPTATPAAAVTETPEPLLVMPVAKTIVTQAKVLSVVRDEETTTQVNQQGGAQMASVPGKILALVVAVPAEAQELLQFAIDNGSVRIALLSAQVTKGSPLNRKPTLGMTWNDLVSLMRMEREAALAQGTPAALIGPGAYAIEATRAAAGQATQAALAVPTATPTLDVAANGANKTPTPTKKP